MRILYLEHGIIDSNAFGHSLLKDTELMLNRPYFDFLSYQWA